MILRTIAAGLTGILGVLAAGLCFDKPASLWDRWAPNADRWAERGDLSGAHAIHPRDTDISVGLGLKQERSGDLLAAEHTLLEAARLDRQYQPAWTLANFYYRRQRPDDFWKWVVQAAGRNAGDLRPLIRLADRQEPNARTLLIQLGGSPEILRPYLDLLLGAHRYPEALEAGLALAQYRQNKDRDRVYALASKLQEAGEDTGDLIAIFEDSTEAAPPLPHRDRPVSGAGASQPGRRAGDFASGPDTPVPDIR